MTPEQLQIDVSAANGKPQRLVEVAYCDERFRSKVDTDNDRSRSTFIKGMLREFRVHDTDAAWLHKLLVEKADAADADADNAATSVASSQQDALEQTPPEVVDEAGAMLDDPHLLAGIMDDIATIGVAGEMELALTVYLVGTSRLLTKPLACIVQGPSSSGKTYIIDNVSRLFPHESVIHATQMTPQALFHMPDGSLVHRFVVAGERSRKENDDTAETTRALREMLSTGRLVKLMPQKHGDQIVTLPIEQDGPISYIESTTLANIFDEDRNRCLLVNTDERPDQTRRVVQTMAERFGGSQPDVHGIIQRHHTMQRMLETFPVVVPFAKKLGALFPKTESKHGERFRRRSE